MSDFIRCDEGTISQTNNGLYLRCRFDDGAEAFTEQAVIDMYGTPRMDNEDFQILGEFAVTCLLIAYGVKLLRKILGN